MIGVLAKDYEAEVVSEFFELFKTPWEFYDNKASYDVVITTTSDFLFIKTKVIIIFDSGRTLSNLKQPPGEAAIDTILIKSGDIILPIYRGIQNINDKGLPIITELNNLNIIGVQISDDEKRVVKIGYNLFREIAFLLTKGQPPKYAHIPTIEHHLSILRKIILDAGIPVIEIPPVPEGFKFVVCLTHDVDFVRIKDHKFDHTMWGFIYRATMGSILNFVKKKIPLYKLWKNWKAVLLLPFVYAGMCRDFWLQFDRYIEIEGNTPSTFFIIPFKNRVGDKLSNAFARRRATKYDILDIQDYVDKLLDRGFEIGVHGIDAWHDINLGQQEFQRISEVTGLQNIGIRIHWLSFNNDSYNILEQADFTYDSTFGYNDNIGYRAGTGQVFKPLGVKKLLELPLHIQDTALFSSKRMNLSETQAFELINKLIKTALVYGGVLTILWHQRSIAPERLLEEYYLTLITTLKEHNPWFGTAGQIVDWFRKRRNISFEKFEYKSNMIHIKLNTTETFESLPQPILRIYHPNINTTADHTGNHTDIPWTGEKDIKLSFSRPLQS